ncbi:translocation/assembly module TamB domain-containing protein [Saccharicrinis sp. GN24d3]|uniref:translocation/assembly module TamB domain-containing protein n=1 Tax=Saccharicrinis sp. GN24d3 TaxID=3458416 RepID=UPI0040359B02
MIIRIIKIASYVLGGIIGLLLLLLMLVRFGYLNTTIVNIVSSQASKNMHGELIIESLQGNIFSDFSLENIHLSQGGDTLLSCQTMHIDYRIWSLLQNKVEVNHLKIIRLHLNVVQEQDSTFNLANVFVASDKKGSETNGSTFDLNIKEFTLSQLTSNINMLEKNQSVPDYIESNLQTSLQLSGDQFEVDLKAFDLATQNPDFKVVKLSGKFYRTLDKLNWTDIVVQLNSTLAKTDGDIEFNEKNKITAHINIAPLDFSDFNALLPGLKLYGSPTLYFLLEGNSDKYTLEASIKQAMQTIRLKGVLSDWHGEPTYSGNLLLEGINGAYWTNDPTLKSHVTGKMQVQGKGFDMHESVITLEGSFKEIMYDNYSFRNLKVNSTKNRGDLKGELSTLASFGDIQLNYRLTTIFSQPKYNVKARYRNLNVQHLPGIDSIYTLLNGTISVVGTGTSLDNLMADVVVNSNNSMLLDYPIDDFKIQANYKQGDYRFTGLNFDTPYFGLTAQGKGNLKKSNHISFGFEARNISPLLSEFNLPGIELQGTLNGQINGKAEDFNVDINLALDRAKYDSLRIGNSNAHILLNVSDKIYQGEVTLKSTDLSHTSYHLQALDLTGDFTKDIINTQLTLEVNDSLNASFRGGLVNFQSPTLQVDQLDINYNGVQWANNQDSTYINLNPKNIYVHQFNLNSGIQNIGVHGVFSFDGAQNLKIDIQDFDLSHVPLQSHVPFRLSGSLSSYSHLTGTAHYPIIHNQTSIEQLNINEYSIDKITTNQHYENQLLTHTGIFNKKDGQPIRTSFSIPLHLSLSDSIYLLRDTPLFSASLHVDSLDVNAMYRINPLENVIIKGFAFANIKVSNTIANPMINGEFKLTKGLFEDSELGAYYKDIHLNASVYKSLVTLNGLSAKTNKKGKLDLNGYLNLENGLSTDSSNIFIKLKTTSFQALRSNRMDMNMDADMVIVGSSQHPILNGQVTLNRSRINADYLTQYANQKTDDPNPPLLLEAMGEEQNDTGMPDSIKSDFMISSSTIFKNLRGTIDLKIPSNTWVRGKNMNFEMNGSLRFLKTTEDIDIVGNMIVRKGSYKMYGRNFNIKEGELTFTGGKELNPYVDFTILYKFRDIEMELRTLKIHITGRMLQPDMEFVLDDDEIAEKDAIAYIVFKKSSDQLSSNQKSKVFSGEELAMGLVLDQLSFVVKESLKQSTGLDVIEITGENNWKTSNVTLGKYITNKLYLSYEQAFLLDKKTKTVNTEKMMLEYEFLRNIVLKATNQNSNSGFDLIFKRKWK